MRGHARHRKAVARVRAELQVAPLAPVGIGHDGLPADLVEGDVLRGVPRSGGDRHRREDAIGVAGRPFSTCMPPIEPPITQNSSSMPR